MKSSSSSSLIEGKRSRSLTASQVPRCFIRFSGPPSPRSNSVPGFQATVPCDFVFSNLPLTILTGSPFIMATATSPVLGSFASMGAMT